MDTQHETLVKQCRYMIIQAHKVVGLQVSGRRWEKGIYWDELISFSNVFRACSRGWDEHVPPKRPFLTWVAGIDDNEADSWRQRGFIPRITSVSHV